MRATITIALTTETEPSTAEEAGVFWQAFEELAAIMLVQSEDGLWLGGYPEAENAAHLADFTGEPDAVTVVVAAPRTHEAPEIAEVAQSAGDAFWQAVAGHFPTANGGDLPPDAALAIEVAMREAIETWVESNVPGSTETPEENT